MSEIEAARKRWIAESKKYDAFGKMLEDRIRQALKPLGLWFEVGSRAKTVDSLVKKLLTKHPKYTFETLPDKVGARVVLRYRSDVSNVVQRVRELFDSDEPEDKLVKQGVNWVGYLSIHIDHVRLREETTRPRRIRPIHFGPSFKLRLWLSTCGRTCRTIRSTRMSRC